MSRIGRAAFVPVIGRCLAQTLDRTDALVFGRHRPRLDGQLIGTELVRLTDARTREAHEAAVRVGDRNLEPAAARRYAAAILAAASMTDSLDPHTT
jgi:hypothetical protein